MKKLIGILGIAVIATAMFFNTNTNHADNIDLSSLIAINMANAEDSGGATCEPGGTSCSTANYCRKGSTYGSTCSM